MAEVAGEARLGLGHVFEAAAAVGTHTAIVAAPAVATDRLEIVRIVVTATAASTVKLQSHDGVSTGTDITSTWDLGAAGSLVYGDAQVPAALGLAGERLDIVVGGTGPVNYSIHWRTVSA